MWGRKRLTTDEVGRMFVHATLDSVEDGWPQIAALIRDSPEFETQPAIDDEAFGPFLLVIVAGNLDFIREHFTAEYQRGIVEAITRHLAQMIESDATDVAQRITHVRKLMSRLNRPSKKTTSAMARGVFTLYQLNDFQAEYFAGLNVPNPLFLKRIDEMMTHFLWDWTAFNKRYKVRKGTAKPALEKTEKTAQATGLAAPAL
jgi:hypothetical protein